MSFSTDINKPNLKKIVLFEIDIPLIFTNWINYEAGIWFTKLLSSNQTITDDRGVTGYYESNVQKGTTRIGSCIVDQTAYTEVLTLALCISTEESFYFDSTNDYVYIHFTGWAPYLNQIIRLGDINGFSNLTNSTGSYYNDIEYEARVSKVPSLTEKKDPLFFGAQNLQSNSIDLINDDGKFDTWNSLNIYGQPARLKIGFDGYAYSDFVQVYEGYIEDYSYTFKNFKVKIKDKRDNLSRKVPYRQFIDGEYPYMNSEDVGKYKPVVLGYTYYYPVVCLNKDESAPTYRTFMFLDTFYGESDSLNSGELKAYIQNDEDDSIYDLITTVTNIDNSKGTFDIPVADVDNADDVPREVFVSAYGYDSVYSSNDALEFVINAFSNVSYNSTFVNTTEISTEFASSEDIGYYIEEPTKIVDIISKLMFADDGYFYTQADGRYSAKKFDSTRASSKTIGSYIWKSDPSFNYNPKDFLSSVTVSGKKHYGKDEFLEIETNDTYERTVLEKYKKYKSESFEIIGNDSASVVNKAENIMLQSKDIVRVVTRVGDISLYDIDVMDIITASHKRDSESEELEEWQVIGKILNLTNFEITLIMKYWGF